MRRTARLSMVIAFLCGGTGALWAQSGGGAPSHAGHSVTGTGVHLLGIEPFSNPGPGGGSRTGGGAGTEGGGGAGAPPDFRGRATQVQYPLDNRAYEGPDPLAPQGYPMYAPDFKGAPGGNAGAAGSLGTEEGWVELSQAIWEATWVVGGGGGADLGLLTNEIRTTLDFPSAPMLTLMPRAAWHLVDGPIVTDLPGQLYDASLETVVSLPLREGWFMQAAVSPSVFTDGQNLSGDALRVPGRLLVFWSCSDTLTLAGGAVYLDREDVGVLPTAGLIWKPNDDWRAELIIPRPRVAWRYDHEGDLSRWLYIVGEFGGGSWAVERANGVDDVATLADYRCLFGWEQTQKHGVGFRLETGLVFNRSLEYVSGVGDRDLPTTGLVRFALSY